MATVTIGAVNYDGYVTVAAADTYLDADPEAADWRSETDDDVKGRAIMSATRLLESQSWLGDKEDDDNALEWPRTGTGITGVEDTVIPEDILDACCELAKHVINGVDIINYQSSAETQRSIRAGSVSITNFRPVGRASLQYPMPKFAWDLVKLYISGVAVTTRASASGTDGVSTTCDDHDHSASI